MSLLLAGCPREKREVRADPAVTAALDHPMAMPNGISGQPPEVYGALGKSYANNAYNLSQGKRLYTWFNCKGCHGDGGGGTGPALFDGWWRYGPDIVSIYFSIRDGRPDGMPSFKDRLTTEQIWQVAGYVQTMGAYSSKTAATSRNDEMQSRPAENRSPASSQPLLHPARR